MNLRTISALLFLSISTQAGTLLEQIDYGAGLKLTGTPKTLALGTADNITQTGVWTFDNVVKLRPDFEIVENTFDVFHIALESSKSLIIRWDGVGDGLGVNPELEFWNDSAGVFFNLHAGRFIGDGSQLEALNATKITSGTLDIEWLGAFSGGQVTKTSGSGLLSIATNAVVNSNLAQAPTKTVKGNSTGATANVSDVTMTTLSGMLGHLTATASLDFNLNSTSSDSKTVTVTGAAVGDSVFLGLPADVSGFGWDAGMLSWSARVTSANTVTIAVGDFGFNYYDPSSATFRVTVFHY